MLIRLQLATRQMNSQPAGLQAHTAASCLTDSTHVLMQPLLVVLVEAEGGTPLEVQAATWSSGDHLVHTRLQPAVALAVRPVVPLLDAHVFRLSTPGIAAFTHGTVVWKPLWTGWGDMLTLPVCTAASFCGAWSLHVPGQLQHALVMPAWV